MDPQLASNWLKDATVVFGVPLSGASIDVVRNAVATRVAMHFPRAHERLANLSEVAGPVRGLALSDFGHVEFGTLGRPVLNKVSAVGLGLLERVEPFIDRLLPAQLQDSTSHGSDDDEEDARPLVSVPAALSSHILRTFAVRLSRSAVLRITVLTARDAWESMLRRIHARDMQRLLARAHVAGVQRQLALEDQRATGVPGATIRAAELASEGCRRLLGDALGGRLVEVVGRAAAVAGAVVVGAQAAPQTPELTAAPQYWRRLRALAAEEEPDCVEEPAADAGGQHAETEPSTSSSTSARLDHVPGHAISQHADEEQTTVRISSPRSSSGALGAKEPLGFRLIVRNSFIEYAEEDLPSMAPRRSRSWPPGLTQSAASSCVSEPFTFVVNCVNAEEAIGSRVPGSGTPSTDTGGRSIPANSSRVMLAVEASQRLGEEEELSPGVRALIPPEPPDPSPTPPQMLPFILPENRPAVESSDNPEVADGRTTVQLRNLPPGATRRSLIRMLDAYGFLGKYSFVYVPADFTRSACIGYALIVLVTPEAAAEMRLRFDGFSDWPAEECGEARTAGGTFIIEASWSEPRQTLEEHIERYRNSPVMHVTVPDEHKPALFEAGVRVAFPPPTKQIRRPRIRHMKDK